MIRQATLGKGLVADVNRVIATACAYLSPDDLRFRRWIADANKLLKARPAAGHDVLGLIHSMTGDRDSAVYHHDMAIRLDPDDSIYRVNKATSLVNLGFFSEAQECVKEATAPEDGHFTSDWELAVCCGAFHTLHEQMHTAMRMQLDLAKVDADLIHGAVQLLDELKLQSKDLGVWLDVAGAMLRENRLFFVGVTKAFAWIKDATEKHLSMIYKLGLPSSEVLSLDNELGHRLFEVDNVLPTEIMIHFESGLPLNERIAERPALAG